MSSIITDVRIIHPEDWMREADGTWYTHIPYECEESDDVLIELIDDEDYVREHERDFNALHSGYTKKNTCIISADIKPSCNIQIMLEKGKLGWRIENVPDIII